MTTNELSDFKNTRYSLILRLKDRYDESSWSDFVEIYQRYIYIIVRRMNVPIDEANDLTQNILIKLWKNLPNFDYNPKIARFRTWLSRVVYNSVLTHLRSLKNKTVVVELDENLSVDPVINQMMEEEWENYISNIAYTNIKEIFSGKAIEVFELSLEGNSIEEIALKLGLKPNSVYRLRGRVKDRLKKEIDILDNDLS